MRMQILFIFLTFSSSSLSFACSCVETKLEDYYSNCKNLFTAVLYEAHISKEDGSSLIGKFRNPKDIMAGDPSNIVGIKTNMLGTTCNIGVHVGTRYLVCGNDKEYITVNSCSLTQPIWRQEKIEKLKAYNKI